ncbi:Flp family type IVb pilin [Rodentibacter caecimuris]|uniref:Fimbrial protein n=1 Tax=Rodentibacter caecimuris TaxID=1796644 RepID=A0ABX3KXL4_9PAST|nr:hypothetical protein BKG89_05580 [Rodentibacter heylii]
MNYKLFTSAFLYLRKFKRDKKGITSIEYGLIGLAVTVFVVSILGQEGFLVELSEKFRILTQVVSNSVLTRG